MLSKEHRQSRSIRDEVLINPLSESERGRGVHLSEARLIEVKAEVIRLLSAGWRQHDVALALNITRSRISRWARSAVFESDGPKSSLKFRQGTRTLQQLVWDRVKIDGNNGCWEWTGAKKANGYGMFNHNGKAYHAHRVMYEFFIEEIHDGQQIDHICRNRGCVNPNHLQRVTPAMNVRLAHYRRRQDIAA